MDLKWLEDFLSLASTGSFSKAAKERHTTQSTLSRRIQALESWLGVPVIDRSSYPVALTRAGEQFHKDVLAIVRSVYRARAATRSRGLRSVAPTRFGAQHALARYFLPPLLREIERSTEIGSVHIKSDNLSNCTDDLLKGDIDFLICYDHPILAEVVDRRRFPSVQLGSETALPVSVPDASGAPLFALPGSRDRPLPYIGFSPDVPVGWHRQLQLSSRDLEMYIDPVHESTMGEIIRDMVRDGRGLAWLQETLVRKDLEEGRLVVAGGAEWVQPNEIRIFRALGPGRSSLEQIWEAISNVCPFSPPADTE